MNLDELFDTTARLGEPGLPGDVLGRVREAQARRRRAQLLALPVAALALAAGVFVPTVLLQRGSSPAPPATRPTQQVTQLPRVPEPSAFVALAEGRAIKVDVASGRRTDLGQARAVTLHEGRPWISRSHGTCADTVLALGTSQAFEAGGRTSALAVSPDGKSIAFSRASTPPSADERDILPCGEAALVVRDLRAGTERVWSATAGSIESLTWSADSKRLAFTQVICCTDDETVRLLAVAGPPTSIDQVAIPGERQTQLGAYCRLRFPVFVGNDLLVDRECSSPDGATRTFVLQRADNGQRVTDLPTDPVNLAVDRSGQHLLITLYGTPEESGALLALNLADGKTKRLGEKLEGAAW